MLSDRDSAILRFEDEYPSHSGKKEETIRTTFGMKAVVYYSVLHVILANPDALAAYPSEVRRLQRIHDVRARARASRGFAA